MISDEGFKKACAILAEPKPIGAATALLPEIVLEDVLTRINGEADQCGLPMGKGLLDRLTDAFPAYDRKAHKRYLESLVESALAHQHEREQRLETARADEEFRQAKKPIEERKRIVQQTLGAKSNAG